MEARLLYQAMATVRELTRDRNRGLRRPGGMAATCTFTLILVAGPVVFFPEGPHPAYARPSAPAGHRDTARTRAAFALRWNGIESRLPIVSTTVVAGEAVGFTAVDGRGASIRSVVAGSDEAMPDGEGGWSFRPPAPGLYTLTVRVPALDDGIRFNIFAAIPREQVRHGALNGFAIGEYPPGAMVRGARLEPPRGFIEVTEANASALVSPRFALGQFLCKQAGGFPKYVLLDDRLPLKLEDLLDRARAAGIRASSLTIMSGYRTPAYNRGLRNVDYSRHLWGAAADVFVDEFPRDGIMDDINGDGRVDRRDSETLAAIAESMDESPGPEQFPGGVGRYGATAAHGPFVHVDVRDRPARW
jgi:hypothetical protein